MGHPSLRRLPDLGHPPLARFSRRWCVGCTPGNPIAVDEPHAPYVEALRALRTSLLLSREGAPPKVVLVTSSIAAEGKSTLSLNLAIILAQHGKNVLLVDADLRRPMLHKKLGITPRAGLSSLLSGHDLADGLPGVVAIESVPALPVLVAGPPPPFPSELLGSAQMRTSIATWRSQFDFILLDGAPVLPVTDSVILSELVDSTLLVARFKLTERQSLQRSYQLLEMQARPEQNPSVTAEGFGMVFAEAQSVGTPVVSCMHSAIPEAVSHGETGLLCPERMPGPLAEALLTFLKDQNFWDRASARSISWVRERFDIAKQTVKLERLYDECREQ